MLSLGFSCYAIKIYYIINNGIVCLKKIKKTGLNISTPSKLKQKISLNSFVDEEYLKFYLNASYLKRKEFIKYLLNKIFIKNTFR